MSEDKGLATENFLLVGVGGQGVLLASDVVALVGMKMGCDVKKSEVHGMAQRGGSVNSHVRWAERVHSPMITPGDVDYLVAFERLEALRYAHMLRPEGHFLINDYRIPPVSASSGGSVYPTEADEEGVYQDILEERFYIPAVTMAQELGSARVNNVVMLGGLSAFLEVPQGVWLEVISERVPASYVPVNQEAFEAGRQYMAARLEGERAHAR